MAAAQRPQHRRARRRAGPDAGGMHGHGRRHLGARAVEPVFEARAGDAAAALRQGGLDMVEGARTQADGVEDQAQHQPGVVDDAVAVGDRRAQAVAAERRLERQRLGRSDAPRGAPAGHAVGDPERRAEGERPGPAAFVDRHHERLRLDQPGSLAQQALALAHRLERHPPLPRLEVAHAAVDQLRRPRRGAAGEVAAIDQQRPEAAPARRMQHRGTGDAAADDQQVVVRIDLHVTVSTPRPRPARACPDSSSRPGRARGPRRAAAPCRARPSRPRGRAHGRRRRRAGG